MKSPARDGDSEARGGSASPGASATASPGEATGEVVALVEVMTGL